MILDQYFFIGNAISSEKQIVEVYDVLTDRKNTARINVSAAVCDRWVNFQTLEASLTDKNGRKIPNVVITVEDRIQISILAALDKFITPRIELAVTSVN